MRPGVLSCFIALSHSCLACSFACLILSDATSLTPFLSLLPAATTNRITCPEPGLTPQVVETDFYLPLRGKVCIQRSNRALALGDRLDLGDLAGYVRPYGDDKAVKRI